jgi:ubiquinone/menaquinone biosynthesis C-methylase UbiE
MRTYDAKAVARLERTYSTPQIVAQRKQLRAVLQARPGELGLDVGCGPGFLACELAPEVAPGGRIVGIDASRDSIDAAKSRIAANALGEVVEARIGDAASLDFPSEHFDFVAGVQVYCYVPDVGRAIQEAARVLRRNGRLVILESDWDLCTWESSDPSLTRRMIAARGEAQYAHAHLPRTLHRLLRAAGLTLVDAQVFPILETSYAPESFGVRGIETTCEAALKQGLPAHDVAAWERDLNSRKDEGEWFFCLNRFVFTARK